MSAIKSGKAVLYQAWIEVPVGLPDEQIIPMIATSVSFTANVCPLVKMQGTQVFAEADLPPEVRAQMGGLRLL